MCAVVVLKDRCGMPPRLHKFIETQSEPSEEQRAQWRKWSSRRRQLEVAGKRLYRLPLKEQIVLGALMATHPGRIDDLAEHDVCEQLLTHLLETTLQRVMHDVTNPELKADIEYMLKGLRR